MVKISAWFVLDTFSLPKDARIDHWSGDELKKDVATMKTADSTIVFDWGTVQADVSPILKWSWMTNDDFDTVQTLYEAAATTYVFGIHDPYEAAGKSYIVDILEFEGKPWQGYYREVTLQLRLRSVV